MTAKDLIQKSGGLKSDVYLGNASIIRTNSDYSTEIISFNLDDLINSKIKDIKLIKEDVLSIVSKNDLNKNEFIKISGQVNNPGLFPFSKNLSLNEIIILGGGFKDDSNTIRAEIIRRVSENFLENDNISELITLDISGDLSESINFILKPYDEVIIRKNPNLFIPTYVHVEGQVKYPGKYPITSLNYRISNLLSKAGGLKSFSYPKGATLIRKTEFEEILSDDQKQLNSLTLLKEKLSNQNEVLTESEDLLIKSIEKNIQVLNTNKINNQGLGGFAKKERIKNIVSSTDTSLKVNSNESEAIGIDLDQIIKNPNSGSDLLLQEGDVLFIPKKQETVKLRGKLLYPTTVRFKENKSFKYFINGAGGYDLKANKSGSYVVYANGDVARTKKFLFFNIYPKIQPGAEIIVPKKAEKSPFGLSQVLNISTGLATLVLAISQIK